MSHVFFNFQGNAVAAVLAFLGFGLVEGVAISGAVVFFVRRKRRLARGLLIGAGGVAGLYGCVLLLCSLTSREQVAARGEEKYFCEVDCHLAYSVTGLRYSRTVGSGADRAIARGT